jgi:hypothetical protein
MGIKLYNRLPLELRKSDGFKDFKHKLKLFLVDHPFYTLQEFLSGGNNNIVYLNSTEVQT